MMSQLKKVILILVLFATVSAPAKSGDVTLPSGIKVKNQQLVLNGSGTRQKLFIDLFVGALYLKEKSCDASRVVNSDEAMAIKIQVISDVITSKRLEEGMRSEFKRVTKGNIKPFKDRIEMLVRAFKEDVKIGDRFDLVYDPSDGLKIFKNNKLHSQIPGLDFKKLVFSTWLGDDPADKNLKNGMLGIKA